MKERLLSTIVKHQEGGYQRIEQWYSGWHPKMDGAVLTNGWTGRETRVEKDIIKPIQTIFVSERTHTA